MFYDNKYKVQHGLAPILAAMTGRRLTNTRYERRLLDGMKLKIEQHQAQRKAPLRSG